MRLPILIVALPGALLFAHFIVRFANARDLLRKLRFQMDEYGASLKRLRSDWFDAIPSNLTPDDSFRDHPYIHDLDIAGRGSLFQFIDRCRTPFGRMRLFHLLANQPDSVARVESRWEERRDAIQELKRRSTLYFRFIRETESARESFPELIHMRWIRDIAEEPIPHTPVWLTYCTLFLAMFSLMSVLIFVALNVPPYFMLTYPFQLILFIYGHYTVGPYARRYADRSSQFSALARLIRTAESFAPRGEFFARMRLFRERPSASFEEIARISGYFEFRKNPILHLIFGLFFLYEFHFIHALEIWLRTHANSIRDYFNDLADFESLLSLSRFAHDQPNLRIPEYARGPFVFDAKGLSHPLLPADRRVANSADLDRIWLLTGSNMSGKSTFLRTVGVNLLLAMTGTPVCADHLRFTPSTIVSSMRHSDNTQRSVSYFYDEVRRLSLILKEADRKEFPLLFLIDEMLRGTNERERLIASRSVLGMLRNLDAKGLVATHDMKLTELCGSEPGFRCMHFEEIVENERMSFDYRLKEGPVHSSNALRILRIEGIPVAEE